MFGFVSRKEFDILDKTQEGEEMTNIISIAERNARIQDKYARELIRHHMVSCLKHFQEALTVQLRYQLLDVPCLEIMARALDGYVGVENEIKVNEDKK